MGHAPQTSQASFSLSRRGERGRDQPISYLMAQAVANPQIISLAAGLVDYPTLPDSEVAEAVEALLSEPTAAHAALQYGTTGGLERLRELAFAHLAELDGTPGVCPGSAEQIVITTGSQQLLHLLTDVLVDEDDIVITAWPSYFVYTGALETFGARVRTVEMDEQGMIPEQLDALLAELHDSGQLHRVKIVYVTSYHQNPTGLTLSESRRPELLDIVKRYSRDHRILLVEDAAYRELTYDANPPRSIKAFDTDNQFVALLHTFSKPFAPGLKTGFGLLPDDLLDPVLIAKGGRDFGSCNFAQHILAEVLQSGAYAAHVQRLQAAYAAKRDAMLNSLEAHFGKPGEKGITWTEPSGGLYVWLTLPDAIDTGRGGPLFARALEQGVLFVPGEYCYPPDAGRTPPRNTIRLSFGVPSVKKIEDGIKRLAQAIGKH